MPVRVVESKDNARLKELRKALAASGRSAQGCAGLSASKGRTCSKRRCARACV